jgi:RNA polymerase sigma-70 factor (ECF subfamily)
LAEAATALVDRTLAQASRGDSSAFEELVRAHQRRVFSIAYHFLMDRSLAEELAQEVFFDLYRNLANIKSSAHLSCWLRKVVTNRCIDHSRRAKTRIHVSLDDIREPVAPGTQPDYLLRDALKRFVAALPEKQRMIVILRYQEDMDPLEISEVLEMPVNTVKTHLRRSLAILRDKLSRSGGDVAL